MNQQSIKRQTFNGIGWSSIERFSLQGVSFVVQLVLARLLTPDDYGIIGMLAIFMQLAQVLIDSGFANALIRKQNCTQRDYSTVFYYNLAFSAIIYILFFFIAPFVANFYHMPTIIPVMRWISLTLIFNALSIIPKTILIKDKTNNDIRENIFKWAVDNNLMVLTIRKNENNLEKIFHDLTSK